MTNMIATMPATSTRGAGPSPRDPLIVAAIAVALAALWFWLMRIDERFRPATPSANIPAAFATVDR